MPNYSKSVIYKIYDNTNGDTYYGSTCNELRYRMYWHKHTDNNCKSKSIILNDDYSYSVVEEFPCETKLELHTRERWWIENNKCINKCVPTRTKKEYREFHIDKVLERDRTYYNDNKKDISLYKVEYYKNNKERILTRLLVKSICECGTEMRTDNLFRHRKSAKHIKLMSCLPCPSPPQSSPP